MDNELTMPIHSHCIDDIELHDETEKCSSANYYEISNISYSTLVGCNDTANTISFGYDHVIRDSSCRETHERGNDSVDVFFEENKSRDMIAHISSIDYQGTDIPYYFAQEGNDECYKLKYVSTSKTNVNTSAFTNPSIISHTYSNGSGVIEFNDVLTSIPNSAFYYEIIEASNTRRYASNFSTITIPNCVTSIGNTAFAYSSGLTSINIPDSVTSIGYNAFCYCQTLTSCTIGSGVTSIGQYAFGSCTSLTSCKIGSGVTSIGQYVFSGCTSLTSIDIPDSVTSIGNYAFNRCYALTSCTIGSGVTTIGNNIFNGCNSLASITIDSSNIVYDSRNNCNAIIETSTNNLIKGCKTTVIPNSVTSIGADAFYECSRLTSIEIPDSVTSIGERAFQSCGGLTIIDIPSGSIGQYAFYNCIGLISCTIGSGVTSISQYAFYNCTSLTSCTIGSGVTSIGQYAFLSCRNLERIEVESLTPCTLGINAFNYTNNCPIYVPSESVEAYKAASGWSTYESRIQAMP